MIHQLFQNLTLQPEDIAELVTAYEQALAAIGLVDRNDPATTLVAKTIIEVYQRGVRTADELCQLALSRLGAR